MISSQRKAAEAEILDSPWGTLRWFASASLGNSETLTVGRATLKAGHTNPVHRHPNCDEVLHVLAGTVEHTLGDEKTVLEAGDTLSIPRGVWHNARALGDGDAEMMICFSSAHRETEFAEAESPQ